MSVAGFIRSGLIGSVGLAIVAGGIGFSTNSFGSAIVGETRRIAVDPKPQPSLEAMKAGYRRPALIPFPKENPYTLAKASLGKKLYFDPRLSAASMQSCASCHSPGFGWGDGLALGVGQGMTKLKRRSPSIVNSAWGAAFMWDGRFPGLEQQALEPIKSADEMNMPIEQLMQRLNSIAGYGSLFAASFPGQGINPATVAEALATFERTVVSQQSPFDAWIEGDEHAIAEPAKRGFVIFNTRGQCAQCHEGWNFTNDGFHDIGLRSADIGRGALLPSIPKMMHAFKTPGLRDIERRGPYMHDGSVATLEDVVELYDDGGIERPSRSDLIRPLDLTAEEKADLVAFLKTLTSNSDSITMPVLPR